jgi:hypothetical protein
MVMILMMSIDQVRHHEWLLYYFDVWLLIVNALYHAHDELVMILSLLSIPTKSPRQAM